MDFPDILLNSRSHIRDPYRGPRAKRQQIDGETLTPNRALLFRADQIKAGCLLGVIPITQASPIAKLQLVFPDLQE